MPCVAFVHFSHQIPLTRRSRSIGATNMSNIISSNFIDAYNIQPSLLQPQDNILEQLR